MTNDEQRQIIGQVMLDLAAAREAVGLLGVQGEQAGGGHAIPTARTACAPRLSSHFGAGNPIQGGSPDADKRDPRGSGRGFAS